MTVVSLPVGGYAPASSSHGAGLDRFRQAMTKSSRGRVEVPLEFNILDRNRPASDLLDLVERGEMFMCYFSTSYLGSRVPALNVIELPYLFSDLDVAHGALDGTLGQRLAAEVEAATGFVLLGSWDNGFRHLSNRWGPLRSPADCAGLTVRLQPNRYHEAMIKGWGAIPVPVELSEGIRLITRDEVDAQENPLANLVAYGVEKFHRYVTMTGHLYGARGLFANARRFRSLDPDWQQLVRESAREAVSHQRRLAETAEAELRSRLEADGVGFVDLTASERDAFVAASQPAWDLARAELPAPLLALAVSGDEAHR
ncbi:MAG TPA: TRAP transporter substrate-binding protein [Acidimicrobiia bacterium]|nr:TRAP transporter substrate-binding protein [Acidimicrobiia bacterium]